MLRIRSPSSLLVVKTSLNPRSTKPRVRKRIEEQDAKFEDIKGICRDCNSEFLWAAGEQGFYEDKGFSEGPKSCLDCRRKAKNLARQAEAAQKSAKPSSGWGNKSGPDSSSGSGETTHEST